MLNEDGDEDFANWSNGFCETKLKQTKKTENLKRNEIYLMIE